MLLGTFVLIAILFVIVMIHEAGHLIIAKKCGVGVTAFAIGFGPRIVGVKFYNKRMSYRIFNRQPSNKYIWNKGETEYKLCPLPFGGYCAMEGELKSDNNPKALVNKTFGQKVAVAMGGCLFNIVSGYAVLVGVLVSKLGFLKALTYGVEVIKNLVIESTVKTGELITGAVPLDKWGDIANASASMITVEGILLQFAFFSIVLALFNLIPFPALDGSLPFLWSLDRIFGKRKGQKLASLLASIGFFLLMTLQLLVVGYWIFG